jgi:hypothetical protein
MRSHSSSAEAAHTRGEGELDGVLNVIVREVVQGDTETTASDERGRDGERTLHQRGLDKHQNPYPGKE